MKPTWHRRAPWYLQLRHYALSWAEALDSITGIAPICLCLCSLQPTLHLNLNDAYCNYHHFDYVQQHHGGNNNNDDDDDYYYYHSAADTATATATAYYTYYLLPTT